MVASTIDIQFNVLLAGPIMLTADTENSYSYHIGLQTSYDTRDHSPFPPAAKFMRRGRAH